MMYALVVVWGTQGGCHMSVEPVPPVRVFVSYAHDSQQHVARVRELWQLLRSCGVDAELDLPADESRQDWALWMLRGIRDSRYVIVVASPEYRRRADGDAPAGVGLGVRWEARLLRNMLYEDHDAALDRIIPVVLPGGSPDDLPMWLCRWTDTFYRLDELTVTGVDRLLRKLTGQPCETVPELEPMVRPAPRGQGDEVAVVSAGGGSPAVGAVGVVEGGRGVVPPASASAEFVFPEPKVLLDSLVACEGLHRLGDRHELLGLMGENLGLGHPFSVAESADARTHLRSLVRRVERTALLRDAVLKALYLALVEIAPDDSGTRGVRELLVVHGLALGEE